MENNIQNLTIAIFQEHDARYLALCCERLNTSLKSRKPEILAFVQGDAAETVKCFLSEAVICVRESNLATCYHKAAAEAKGDYILFLRGDVILAEDFFDRLDENAKVNDFQIVYFKNLTADGAYLSPSCVAVSKEDEPKLIVKPCYGGIGYAFELVTYSEACFMCKNDKDIQFADAYERSLFDAEYIYRQIEKGGKSYYAEECNFFSFYVMEHEKVLALEKDIATFIERQPTLWDAAKWQSKALIAQQQLLFDSIMLKKADEEIEAAVTRVKEKYFDWINRMENDKVQLQQWIEGLEKEKRKQNSWIDDLEAEKKALKNWVDWLEAEKKEQRSWIEGLEKEKRKQNSWIDDLEAEKKEQRSWIEGLEKEKEDLISRSEHLQAERASLNDQNTELKEKLAQQENATESLGLINAQLTDKLNAASKELDKPIRIKYFSKKPE